MTLDEAIKRLEFDQSMILFDALTGKEFTPEEINNLNKDNYMTYIANGIAIEAMKELQQYREIGTVEECRNMAELNFKVCETCGSVMFPRIVTKTFKCEEKKIKVENMKIFKCKKCGQECYDVKDIRRVEHILWNITQNK